MGMRNKRQRVERKTYGAPVDEAGVTPVVGDTIISRIDNPWADGGKYSWERLYVCEVNSDPAYIVALLPFDPHTYREKKIELESGDFIIQPRTKKVWKDMMDDMVERANHSCWVPSELSSRVYRELDKHLKRCAKQREEYAKMMKAKDPDWIDYGD